MANQFKSINPLFNDQSKMNLKAKKASMFLPLKPQIKSSSINYCDSSFLSSSTPDLANRSFLNQKPQNYPFNNINKIYSPISPFQTFSPIYENSDYESDFTSTPVNQWSFQYPSNHNSSTDNYQTRKANLSKVNNSLTRRYYLNNNNSGISKLCPVCTDCCSVSKTNTTFRKYSNNDDSILSKTNDPPSKDELESLIDMAELSLLNYLRERQIDLCALSNTSSSNLYDTKFCKFCKSNNEPREIYLSHLTRDKDNNVVCPILKTYTCPICNVKGHTRSYCNYSQIIRTAVDDINVTHEFYNMGALKAK